MDKRKSEGFRSASELADMCGDEFLVNLEIAKDVLEEEHGPLNERSWLWSSGTSSSPMQPANYNLFNVPSLDLGSLTKSPSLLESIQMQPYESCYSEAVSETGSNLKDYPGESSRSWMTSGMAAMDEFPEDDLEEEEHGPLNKRFKFWSSGTSSSSMQPANYYLLDEPSPFRKHSVMESPSLYESIQMQDYESGFSEAVSATCSGLMDYPGLESIQMQPYETGYSKSVCASNCSGLMNYPGESSCSWMDMRKSGCFIPASQLAAMCRDEFPVNLETVEDVLEAAPLNKRSRLWSSETSSSPMQPAICNLFDEANPLGQHSLMKNPSMLESIQMQPYETGYSKAVTATGSSLTKESKRITAASVGATKRPGRVMKQKASNFPASLLKIGNWEWKSRYVCGLVAKLYFAKRKLVWEVMEQGLKSKIEIEWSNIIALKTNCPQDGPGTLTLVLAKQPLFFRETKPTPRKPTMWQKTSDFTYGQASMNRQHILQCDQGIMNKHIEKLVQSDLRLFHLNQQPEIVMDSPYFDARQSTFQDPSGESKCHPYGNLNLSSCPSISGTQNLPSVVEAQSSSKHMYLSHTAPSPSSVIDVGANEGNGSAEAINTRNTMNCVQKEVFGPGECMPLDDFYEICYDSRNITDSSQVEEKYLDYRNLYQ